MIYYLLNASENGLEPLIKLYKPGCKTLIELGNRMMSLIGGMVISRDEEVKHLEYGVQFIAMRGFFIELFKMIDINTKQIIFISEKNKDNKVIFNIEGSKF